VIKLVFLLRSNVSEPANSFRERILLELSPRILGCKPMRYKINLTSADPPRISITPYRRDRIALISIWEPAASTDPAARWSGIIGEAWDGPCAGYRVEESQPVAYKRSWPAGSQTPGLGLLTLFRSRPGISQDDFIRMWHQGHTPLGMRIHPLWNYVRNVVTDSILPDSPVLGGIVEEHCRCSADLLNPVRFFGGPIDMVPNMLRIGLDIRKWMDFGSIENYLVTEHWIKD